MCERSIPGSHLANIKTDAEFLSITSFLKSCDHLLLLWTALNDHEVRQTHINSNDEQCCVPIFLKDICSMYTLNSVQIVRVPI